MDEELMRAVGGLERKRTEEVLRACNRLTEPCGLRLSEAQIREVAAQRGAALRGAGRVEFGEGILRKLILAFRDSPYLDQRHYPQTLIELQEEFYLRKNGEAGLTDDALLARMRREFDHQDREEEYRRGYGTWYGGESDQ